MAKEFYGKLFANKGYIPPRLFDSLFKNEIHIVTKARKNTKERVYGLSNLLHKQNCRMFLFSMTSLSFFENIWTPTNLGPYVVLGGNGSPVKAGNRHQIFLHNNLCHLRMTPYGAAIQEVNDAPYTTPAKKGPKIASRAYCRQVIFSGPPLRTILT